MTIETVPERVAGATTAGTAGRRPVRVAWLGPAPSEVGGVPSMARQMILGLVDGRTRPALWAILLSGTMLLVVSVLLQRRS